jgi:hypothetical protein
MELQIVRCRTPRAFAAEASAEDRSLLGGTL